MDDIWFFFLDPILDLLMHRHYTGKWRFSALLRIAMLAFFALAVLGLVCKSTLLAVIGSIGAGVSFLADIVCIFTRDREFRDEIRRRRKNSDKSE